MFLIWRLVTGKIVPYSKPVSLLTTPPHKQDLDVDHFQFHQLLNQAEQRPIETLDKHLATRTYFVGERITLADIAVAAYIQRAVAITLGAAERANYPHLMRHLETIVNQPNLKDVFGETEYAEKPMQYTPPPKEKKPEKPAAAAPAPKAEKAEKKPKAKVEEDEEEEEEPLVPAEPKVKNPLDA
jgi:elongation factor 1-gamma